MRQPRSRPSVRKLMAWTLAVGCGLGWWIPSRTQRDAVAAIRRSGGRVAYGWDLLDTGLRDPNGKQWWRPSWLVDLVGPDYFSTVRRVAVDFQDTRPHLDLAVLARLGGLKWLTIHAPMADTDLARIGELTHLRRLDLLDTGIGDAGLAHLQGLRDLRALDLAGTQVTDAAVDLLAAMPSLRSVDLQGTQVTAAGAQRLRATRRDLSVHY